jgi:hypothetical protein
MKNWCIFAVALLAVISAGCVTHAKPNTPPTPATPVAAGDAAKNAPPSEPLSSPQTTIEQWPAQPLDPDALLMEPQPPSPAPTTAPPIPAANAHRTLPPPQQAPKPETQPVVPEATPPARPPLQEALTDARRNALLESAHNRQREVHAWLERPQVKQLGGQARRKRDAIQSLLKLSEEAEKRGDFEAADKLADRALVSVQELQGGR